MRISGIVLGLATLGLSAAAFAQDFDRDLSVPAQADLYVSTGSGRHPHLSGIGS